MFGLISTLCIIGFASAAVDSDFVSKMPGYDGRKKLHLLLYHYSMSSLR